MSQPFSITVSPLGKSQVQNRQNPLSRETLQATIKEFEATIEKCKAAGVDGYRIRQLRTYWLHANASRNGIRMQQLLHNALGLLQSKRGKAHMKTNTSGTPVELDCEKTKQRSISLLNISSNGSQPNNDNVSKVRSKTEFLIDINSVLVEDDTISKLKLYVDSATDPDTVKDNMLMRQTTNERLEFVSTHFTKRSAQENKTDNLGVTGDCLSNVRSCLTSVGNFIVHLFMRARAGFSGQ